MLAPTQNPSPQLVPPSGGELVITKRIEEQATQWPDRANAVVIADQKSYNDAVDLTRSIKDLRVAAEQHHRPMIDAAHKAHKAALEGLKRVDAPLESAERIIKSKIAGWDIEQRRLERERQLVAEAEEKARQDALLEKEIEHMEAAGARVEEVKAVIQQAITMPVIAPPPAPVYQKAKGVTTIETWSAEVYSLIDLVKYVAANPQFVGLLQANQTALNAQARSLKQTMQIPGVKAKRDATVRATR